MLKELSDPYLEFAEVDSSDTTTSHNGKPFVFLFQRRLAPTSVSARVCTCTGSGFTGKLILTLIGGERMYVYF